MADLLTVDEVLRRVLARFEPLPAEDVPVARALGRVLAEDMRSGVDLPPFSNSAMDGYAVRGADVATAAPAAPVTLAVSMDLPAGSVPDRALGAGEAARIMTGAPLPPGADTVVPVEHTGDPWVSDGSAALPERVVVYRAARTGDHVRAVGEDIRAGQTILRQGTVLRPQDIGVLVAMGWADIPVFLRPRVAILSTGDELVGLEGPLPPGKIRNSNSYVLAGLVETYGGDPIRLPVARDAVAEVRERFREALAQHPHLVISSAGVSVGTRDVVRTVVDELGQVELWRVNLRPGKPLAFGHVAGVPFFGLPGNPVSAMVTFEIFVRPALFRLTGRDPYALPTATVVLGEDIQSDGRRSYLRVTLERAGGDLIARTTGTQSSGALSSMVLADGLLIVPEGVTEAPAGSRLTVWLLRDICSFM